MPQMMPMMWMSIFFFVALMFSLLISFLHFYFINSPSSVNLEFDPKESWLK